MKAEFRRDDLCHSGADERSGAELGEGMFDVVSHDEETEASAARRG